MDYNHEDDLRTIVKCALVFTLDVFHLPEAKLQLQKLGARFIYQKISAEHVQVWISTEAPDAVQIRDRERIKRGSP